MGQHNLGRNAASAPVVYALLVSGSAVQFEQARKRHVASGSVDDESGFGCVHMEY